MNSHKQRNLPNKDTKSKIKWQRDKDAEMVKGIFHFYEVPGGSMSFPYKAYAGDEVMRFDFIDGQVYTIPLGVAKHLNKNCWYPEYGFIAGEKGVSDMGANQRIMRKVRRCSFQSLEFVDVDDLTATGTPEIVQVENIL
jgi:hypothetical protein